MVFMIKLKMKPTQCKNFLLSYVETLLDQIEKSNLNGLNMPNSKTFKLKLKMFKATLNTFSKFFQSLK